MMLVSFGTRPEWIKIKPVLNAIKGIIPYKLVFTGQHLDILDNIDQPVHTVGIVNKKNRLDSIVSSLLHQDELFDGVSSLFVQGDTTSVFGMALAAFHRGITIIHLEAGLRTYDNKHPFPEEFNRRSVSCMADIHLCPTSAAADILKSEKVNGDIYVVGNTVLDNLVGIKTEYGREIVVTMHRRENHHIMHKWFTVLNKIAGDYPQYDFVIPLHPNPNVQKHKHLLTNIKVENPIPYDKFIQRLANCHLVITDSGGIQEETSFFKKKCIVCREQTERTESLDIFSFLTDPDNIESLFRKLEKDHIPTAECPYGDGSSSKKIAEILLGLNNV